VRAAGYEDRQVAFDVAGDEATVVDVTLQRVPVSPTPTTPGDQVTTLPSDGVQSDADLTTEADQSEPRSRPLSSFSFRPLGGVGLLIFGGCMNLLMSHGLF
jgi:hypothetical protein